MSFVIIEDPKEIDYEKVVGLFESCGWGNRGGGFFVKKAFLGSPIVAFALSPNQEVIGAIRALTDGVYYASIHDFLVHPEHRGKKIGTLLLQRVMQKLQNIPTVFVSALPESVSFYENFGFVPHGYVLARFINPKKEEIFRKSF